MIGDALETTRKRCPMGQYDPVRPLREPWPSLFRLFGRSTWGTFKQLEADRVCRQIVLIDGTDKAMTTVLVGFATPVSP